MEIRYKNHSIEVTSECTKKLKWKPTCRVRAVGQTLSKELEWDVDYATSEQAERVGLIVSKKLIDIAAIAGRNPR